MASLARRDFIKGVAALSVTACLPAAHATTVPLIRHDIATPAGHAMLEVYARAVASMQKRGATDPTSWMWQWYTHFVDGTRTKSGELTRLFGTTTSTRKSLATEMWNTCQSHAGQNSNHFLPWHRLYTHALERIVRVVSGRPDFALPYWDYTSPAPAKRGVLPWQFRAPTHTVFKTLYRADRTSRANAGLPIHGAQPGDVMDISAALAAPSYSTVGTVQGFCRAIDSGIHGRIHVLVGTTRNMGAVPYAARDPLFWVHHASIDRMWEAWTRNGGINPTEPTWASNRFVFADPWRRRISLALKDCYDCTALGYAYDTLPAMPVAGATVAALGMADARMADAGTADAGTLAAGTLAAGTSDTSVLRQRKGSSSPERIAVAPPAQLRAEPVQVELSRKGQPDPAIALDATAGGRRAYLVLSDLHAWAQPGVLYHVYLGDNRGAARLDPRQLAGTIHFFDAEFHDHGGGPADEALGENFYSFDVTALLQSIARNGGSATRRSLFVTIAPGGVPAPKSEPLVARVELVFQ